LNELQTEEKIRLRRKLTEQAIGNAMSNQWIEAIETNQQLVDDFGPDVEAYNRLGKAYAQLGRITDARGAYESSIKIDPTNTIAQRNIQRLAALKDAPVSGPSDVPHADPTFFIEETGKTVATAVFSDAPKATLAALTAGDFLDMQREGDVMVVVTRGGERLGVLDGRLSSRLIELQEGGNVYAIAAIAVNPQRRELRVLIREMRQSPGLAGRVSFPPETSSTFRAYLRPGGMIREDRMDDDDDGENDADTMGSDEEDMSGDGMDFGEDTAES